MNTNYSINLVSLNQAVQGLKRYNYFTRFFHKTVTVRVVNDAIQNRSKFSFLTDLFRKIFYKNNVTLIYFDRKRAVLWLKNHGKNLSPDAKSQEIALAICELVNKNSQAARPIIKTGGFANGGNTCFIAATLQCLKFMPSFIKKLREKHPVLEKVEDESEEKFEIRKKVAKQLYKLLEDSLSGRTITSQEMNAFHLLLAQFSDSFVMGKGGQIDGTYSVFCSSVFGNYKRYENGIRKSLLLGFSDENFKQKIIECQEEKNALLRFKKPPSTMIISLTRTGKLIDLPYELKLFFQGVPNFHKYRLTGVVEHTGEISPHGGHGQGHTLAYIKDQNGWVKFDDGQEPKGITKISDRVNRSLSTLFYEII